MKKRRTLLLIALLVIVCALVACNDSATTTTQASDTTASPDTTVVPNTTSSAPKITTPNTTLPATKPTTPLDGDDAMAAYAFISEKMNALRGFEATFVEESVYAGMTDKTEMQVKVALDNGKKSYMSIKMEDGTMDATYIDGLVYVVVKSVGFEMKYKTRDESMIAAFEGIFNAFEKENDGKQEIASVSFVSRENGVYTLTATMTEASALETIMADYEGFEIDASEFSNISKVITIECGADGYVVRMAQTLSYTFDGEVYRESMTCNYVNIGVVPEISAPADADSYMDMDAME